MVKKLTKHGNSWAVIIDKPLLKLLGINERSSLEISIAEGTLLIKPSGKKTKKTDREIDAIADRVMDKYEKVFNKLALATPCSSLRAQAKQSS